MQKSGISNIDYIEIIQDINTVLGTCYKTTPVAMDIKKLINARFKDGCTIEDFKAVHRKMFKAWNDDPKMKPFLRPQTLYTGKFTSYLNYPEIRKAMCVFENSKDKVCYFDCPGCDYAKKEGG